jgi:hypothetical protein
MTTAFDIYVECEAIADTRRVGRALRRLGAQGRVLAQPRAKTGWNSLHRFRNHGRRSDRRKARPTARSRNSYSSPLTGLKTHLHNAFAKLGITSRAQLAQLMRGSD